MERETYSLSLWGTVRDPSCQITPECVTSAKHVVGGMRLLLEDVLLHDDDIWNLTLCALERLPLYFYHPAPLFAQRRGFSLVSLGPKFKSQQRHALLCASLRQQRACAHSRRGLDRLLPLRVGREGHIAVSRLFYYSPLDIADDVDWDLQIAAEAQLAWKEFFASWADGQPACLRHVIFASRPLTKACVDVTCLRRFRKLPRPPMWTSCFSLCSTPLA